MKPAHTNGKWKAIDVNDDFLTVHTSTQSGSICDVRKGTYTIEKEEAKANARLIAAAPSMLNALFTIRDNNRDVLDGSTVELINSLINKAT